MKLFSSWKALSVALLAAMCSPQNAQTVDFNSLRSVIRLNAPEKITASRNEQVTVDVTASLKPGYHINSNVAPTFAMKVRLADNGAAQLANVVFPAPKSHKLGDEVLSVFDGDFKLKLTFKVSPDAPIGRTMLSHKISYQACDDRVCLRPDSIELKLPLDIRN